MRTACTEFAAGAVVIVPGEFAADGLFHLMVRAASVTTEQMAFVVRHSSGFVEVAMPDVAAERLGIPEATGARRRRSRQCVSVDAVGTGTGISARDRALTARTLADPASTTESFSRPGHLVPVSVDIPDRRVDGDAASAALRLADLAGTEPFVVSAVLTLDGVDLPCFDDVVGFAREQDVRLMPSNWDGRR
ncbi:3,4-dihydroxy-2-butanone-4-phosphate synthase [Gordonia terrae]